MPGSPTSTAVQKTPADEVSRLLGPFMRPRRFKRGNFLWRRGDPPGMMVLLCAGQVKIYRALPGGRTVTLFLFGPGEVFGFLPLLDGEPYPGTARAVEDVEALVLTRDQLVQAIHDDPGLAVQLVALLGRRLRAAMDTVEGLCTRGVKRRVAAALLEFVDGDDDPLIHLPVSAHEFAGVVGVAPETVSRTLTCLEGSGVLARQGRRRYRVLDLEALRGAATAPSVS